MHSDTAYNAIFDYLEIFHNQQRRHSALGVCTPIEFELLHQSAQPGKGRRINIPKELGLAGGELNAREA
ncbi:IS3 family transposase, partial [Mycolicibacterium celeriflavum]|uniref:IS3 family transposase n=1 Tax=Mycolicibacterium celeriflavum TaxID=1249101 RepID=UPI002E0DDEEC